jgi:hypothetical protein
VMGTTHAKPGILVLTPVDTAGWKKWLAEMAPAFAKQLPGGESVEADTAAFDSTRKLLEKNAWAFAILPPRGEGPHQWNPDPRKDTALRRSFVLLGRTLDDSQVWDTRRAFQALRNREELKEARPWLLGEGRMAGIALYAGLFEPEVDRFDLHQLPPSSNTAPILLNVLKVLDTPQAVALTFPRKVMLYGADEAAFGLTRSVAAMYDAAKPPLQFRK